MPRAPPPRLAYIDYVLRSPRYSQPLRITNLFNSNFKVRPTKPREQGAQTTRDVFGAGINRALMVYLPVHRRIPRMTGGMYTCDIEGTPATLSHKSSAKTPSVVTNSLIFDVLEDRRQLTPRSKAHQIRQSVPLSHRCFRYRSIAQTMGALKI